jgi:hypothetical protein
VQALQFVSLTLSTATTQTHPVAQMHSSSSSPKGALHRSAHTYRL